eukprot:Platyproteum_vivax@DN3146_c0_g1_i1.p1
MDGSFLICSGCNHPIEPPPGGKISYKSNKFGNFHKECVKCEVCGNFLDGFYEECGRMLCGRCALPRCNKCGELAQDTLSCVAGVFHPKCFRCENCNASLQRHFVVKGTVVCPVCYQMGNASCFYPLLPQKKPQMMPNQMPQQQMPQGRAGSLNPPMHRVEQRGIRAFSQPPNPAEVRPAGKPTFSPRPNSSRYQPSSSLGDYCNPNNYSPSLASPPDLWLCRNTAGCRGSNMNAQTYCLSCGRPQSGPPAAWRCGYGYAPEAKLINGGRGCGAYNGNTDQCIGCRNYLYPVH